MYHLLAATTLLLGAAPQDDSRPYRELLDLDRLPELRRGVRAYQTSSFDKMGLNDDGFTGLFSFLHVRANRFVLFDEEGPGALKRMHFAFIDSLVPGGGYDDYRLFFYFDDEPTPRLDILAKDLVSGTVAPFLYPMAMDDVVSPGGPLIALPIPFRSRLRVESDLPVHYYDWQYHRYVSEGNIESFDGSSSEAIDQIQSAVAQLPLDPKPALGNEITSRGNAALPAWQATSFFSTPGNGQIRAILLEFDKPLDRDALHGLWIRGTFDSAACPQIDAPLGLFFGDEQAEKDLHGFLFGHDSALGYYCYFPMPFEQSVALELVNKTPTNRRVRYEVVHAPRPFDGDFGYFHAEFNEAKPTRFLEPYAILHRQGHGHFVGCALTAGSDGYLGGHQLLTYLEGDERIYIDGSRSPQIHGTGTEEFFNWGWYEMPLAREFQLPWHGHPTRWIQGIRDYSSMYRSMHSDFVPFYRSIRVELEVGPLGEVPANYRSVAFYYARDESSLSLTDAFDVGDPAEEAAHGYTSTGNSIPLPMLTAFYEGGWLDVTAQDDGREEDQPHSFDLAIDPQNRGALLRRRANIRSSHQQAEILVDGVPTGHWRTPRTNPWRGWVDEEFDIPGRLTQGKSRLRIEVRPTAAGWNAYRYEAFSYLH